MGQVNSIIMVVIGGGGGIPFLVIGSIGFVNTCSCPILKESEETTPQEEINNNVRGKETDIPQNREPEANTVIIKSSAENPLSVESASADHFLEVAEELRLWGKIALSKYLEVHNGKSFLPRTRDEAASDKGSIFKNSMSMIEKMSH